MMENYNDFAKYLLEMCCDLKKLYVEAEEEGLSAIAKMLLEIRSCVSKTHNEVNCRIESLGQIRDTVESMCLDNSTLQTLNRELGDPPLIYLILELPHKKELRSVFQGFYRKYLYDKDNNER